jgi:hypothetical protein
VGLEALDEPPIALGFLCHKVGGAINIIQTLSLPLPPDDINRHRRKQFVTESGQAHSARYSRQRGNYPYE